MNAFVASFNGGADTFTGIDYVIFGPPNAMGLLTFSSTLTITAEQGCLSEQPDVPLRLVYRYGPPGLRSRVK